MVYNNFEQLISKVKNFPTMKKVAVVAAGDEHTIEAVLKAREEGIVEPILVGDKKKIEEILKKLKAEVSTENIYDAPGVKAAAKLAVDLVNAKKADFLMKGNIETSDLLKAVVNKESGLGTGRLMSHFVIQQLPTYHKMLVTTDGGMMMYPTLEQKKAIIENAVETLHAIGYENPKVAVLAAVEKVNPKMPETIDADELAQMNKNGEIKGCIVEGPLSLDIALSKEIAEIKGFNSQVAGDVDVLIVPNITVGNILGKSLVVAAKAKMAGFIVGAKVPIVLTSRGSSAEEKYLSLVMSAAAAN